MSREILADIINDFEAGKFVRFFRKKSRTFAPLREDLLQYEDDNFKNGWKLGEIKFDSGEQMLVCTFRVNQPISERSGKKSQYEKAKRILKDSQSDAGIFVFHDTNNNFRFSLIFAEYLGVKRKFSYFKRLTFFVSPRLTNKTFLQQVGEGDFSCFESIKEAFSVEPVTKQFYGELQYWYFWAMDKIKFPDDYKYSNAPSKDKEIRNATNLIRLITRIIFIWFLTEKGLIPPELFSREKLRSIVKDFMKGERASNFYNAILQNLFFGTLNQKIDERKFAQESGFHANRKEYGVKNLYRYGDKFLINKNKVLEVFRDIPFLNGGLFDCLDKEDESGKVIYVDGFSRNPAKQSIIPDYLFFQQEEEKVDLSSYGLGARKPARGLIEILNSYNFTIDENTPIDQEIALDPELLGRVFENLLASYNPETATTARKATGSYYTPREIVDYMVEESLFEHLKGKLSEIEEEKIRMLLSYSEEIPEFPEPKRQQIISAIDDIKILDPACGSGAFPMGILHRLVYSLQKLDPENKYWHELQYQKALKESEVVFKQSDKNERQERLKEINETFDEGINYPDYARKLYLIENCIYGIDIQPIAIQIAKLRFFISLVLDQKVDRGKENFGIRALPNLETKFVAANTLIGLDRPKRLTLKNPDIENKEEELKQIRHKYFEAKTRKEKLDYQKKDQKIRKEIADLLKNDGWDTSTAEKIVTFDLYDQNASTDWFDPEWMFGIKNPSPLAGEGRGEGGFDIVIANPPYVKEYTNRKVFDGLRNSPYYQGKMDIWYLFACGGIDLLKKDAGFLTFIAQNNWVTSYGASKMRNKVIKDAQILSLIDFGNFKIFEAGIQTMIMMFRKNTASNSYSFDYRKLHGNNLELKNVISLLNREKNIKAEYLTPTITRSSFIDRTLTFSSSKTESILEKISSKADFRLSDKEVANGIHHHHDRVNKQRVEILGGQYKAGDGIFVLSNEEKERIPFTKKELDLIKPSYTTKELFRWYGNSANQEWVIYTDSSFKDKKKIENYPNIKKHLDRFRKVITSDNKPYGLHRARDEYFFKGEKIIAVRKCARPTFTYVDFDSYVSATFYVIKTEKINQKYLIGLLNSNLITFWLKHRGKMQGTNYQVDKEPIIDLPILKADQTSQNAIASIVTKIVDILRSKSDNEKQAKVREYERQIDEMMYALYGLTENDIRVIEGFSKG